MDQRVNVLRETARRLSSASIYQWGHMGMCNCGHLARTVRNVSEHDLHRAAMAAGGGDWSERVADYCPESGLLIDSVIRAMLVIGFSRREIERLERLSDPEVLKRLGGRGSVSQNRREDAIAYMRAWADMLEEQHAAVALVA